MGRIACFLVPRTVVGVRIYRAGAAPKVGYTNESDGARPLCHVGIFLGACSDCRLSLLNFFRTRQGMPSDGSARMTWGPLP